MSQTVTEEVSILDLQLEDHQFNGLSCTSCLCEFSPGTPVSFQSLKTRRLGIGLFRDSKCTIGMDLRLKYKYCL